MLWEWVVDTSGRCGRHISVGGEVEKSIYGKLVGVEAGERAAICLVREK